MQTPQHAPLQKPDGYPAPFETPPATATTVGPPVAFFASAMGVASLGLAWRLAAKSLPVSPAIGESILGLGAIVFCILAVAYVRKAVATPALVRMEFADPIVSSYFGTVTISLSLFAVGLLPYSQTAATILWGVAATASLVLLLALMRAWISTPRDISHITPAWFIPIVGNAVAVYAASALGFHEIAWLFFAVAMLCWLTLQPLVFYRLIFHDAIPDRLKPTLATLVSSPAVLASAWFEMDGHVADPIFSLLAFKALFLAALVFILTPFHRKSAFSPTWWGYGFPAAAMAGAFVRYDSVMHSQFGLALAWMGLAVATSIVAYLAVRATASILPRILPLKVTA